MQYSVLIYLFAHLSGLEPGEFVHVIADAHIYDHHIPIVEELIKRPVYNAPEFVMNKDKTDFYKYTTNDFKLIGYEKGPHISFPMAV